MKLKGLIAAPAVALLVTGLSAAPVNLPEGWLVAGSTRACRVSTEDAKDAPTPKVFVIDCPKDTRGFATIMQQFQAQGYAGKRVRLSAQVQGDNLQNWGGVWMRGDAGDVMTRAFDNMQSRPLKGSFGWRDAAVVLDVPAEVDVLNIGFLLSEQGVLRATQFKLEVVPETVPVTSAGYTAPPRNRVSLPGPRNLTPP